MINPETDRVVITGAAGAIGTALRTGLRAHWHHLRLTDIRPIQDLTNNEEAIVADIADRPALEGVMQDVRAVVHLAGLSGNYALEDLFRVNARGLFDVFKSARLAGVQRIVLPAATIPPAAIRSPSASRPHCRPGVTVFTAGSRFGAKPCCAPTMISMAYGRFHCASGPSGLPLLTRAHSRPG